MTLQELYQYVFDARAIIKFDDKLDEKKREEFSDRKKTKVRKDFEFLNLGQVANNKTRQSFLNLLSSLNTPASNALKNILYGEEKSNLTDIQLEVVRKEYFVEEIKNIFFQLNRQYKYFTGAELAQAANDYIQFFRACKLECDFIERNNGPDNNVAATLAYKALVTCGAVHAEKRSLLGNLDSFLKEQGKANTPLNDTFTKPIPTNEPPIQDMAGWRQLIKCYGQVGLEYFQEAPGIESKLNGKAPKTKEEAEKAASQIKYTRASEYPEMARLFRRYHLNETIFNRCLEIEKKRKQRDQLPDISVEGKILSKECSGYYLVKLPIDDPRAYILGHITNCCQSMGGHSEKCVIDGVTREKNGFYVLLKEKKKTDVSPVTNGKINYESFDIIGQGYAWLSRHQNLVFDSWENLRPEADNKILVPMLKEFSKKVTAAENNIVRVMIGTRGKTPKEFETPIIKSEVMAEGYQYGDSSEQYQVYYNEEKLNDKIESTLEGCKNDLPHNPLWQSKEQAKIFISSLSLSSFNELGYIEEIFLDKKLYNFWENPVHLSFIKQNLNAELLMGMHVLHYHKLLDDEHLTLLVDAQKKSELFCSSLLQLTPDLVTDKNIKFLYENVEKVEVLSSVLEILYKADPELINDTNLDKLSQEIKQISGIKIALSNLSDVQLLNHENFKIVLNNSIYAQEIGYGLQFLMEVDHKLINEYMFKLLVSYRLNAARVGMAISVLYQANPELIEENLKVLVKCDQYMPHVSLAIKSLYEANSALVTSENIRLLASYKYDAGGIAAAISSLSNVNPPLMTEENFKAIVTHRNEAKPIGDAISIMQKVSPGWVDEKNLSWLMAGEGRAEQMTAGISDLYDTSPVLITKENIKFLTDNVDNAASIAIAITSLYKSNQALVNENNLTMLAQNPSYAAAIGIVIARWNQVNPSLVNEESRAWLLSNLEKIGKFAMGLEILHEKSPELVNESNLLFLKKHIDYADKIGNGISYLFGEDPALVNDENIKLLTRHAKKASELGYMIACLHKANPEMVTTKNCEYLATEVDLSWRITRPLSNLGENSAGLLNDKILNLIMAHLEQAGDLVSILIKLHKANPKFIDDECLKFLAENEKHAYGLANAVSRLSNANQLSKKNINLLFDNVKNAYRIGNAIVWLNDANPTLVNDANLRLLAANPNIADDIGESMAIMYKANPAMLNEKNITLIASNPENSYNIRIALSNLYKESAILINEEIIRILADNSKNAKNIGNGISSLYTVDPKLINNENIKFLTDNALYADELGRIISFLHQANHELVSDENKKRLLEMSNHLWMVRHALGMLVRSNPLVLNENCLKLLIVNSENCRNIGDAIYCLSQADPALVNNISFELLLSKPVQSCEMASGLCNLYKECLQMSALSRSKLKSGMLSNSLLISCVDKLRKHLCGDESVVFNQNELQTLRDWKLNEKAKNVITVDNLMKSTKEKKLEF